MRRPVKNKAMTKMSVKSAAVKFAAVVSVAAVLTAATSCSTTPEAAESKTLKIVYQKTDSFTALDTVMQDAKKEFEASNSGMTVDLQPIQANDDDYGTKLALAQRSADTAPDVFYEDTFKVRSDVDAGYLLKLDSYLEKWDDWGGRSTKLPRQLAARMTAAFMRCRWARIPGAFGITSPSCRRREFPYRGSRERGTRS